MYEHFKNLYLGIANLFLHTSLCLEKSIIVQYSIKDIHYICCLAQLGVLTKGRTVILHAFAGKFEGSSKDTFSLYTGFVFFEERS